MPAVRRLRPRVGPRIAARVPEGFDTRPYERFSVEPLAPTIGAEVEGISLADPIDDALLAELNRALLEWKVLFFRDQDSPGSSRPASPADWGRLEHHPFVKHHVAQPEDAPEVLRLEKSADAKGVENVWHSDVTWREEPVARLGAARHRGAAGRRRHAVGRHGRRLRPAAGGRSGARSTA